MRWIALTALACGAPAANTVLPASDQAVFEQAAGAQIVALPRATEGRIWLSLWIDAGSRDADPPQVATLAAWNAEDNAISARVLPDGTELARMCTRDALDECLASLARALEDRDADDLRERLAIARQRAAGERRIADALALEGLFGANVDPLGRAADDARADVEAVRSFLADHYGAGRLLVIAIGDVTAVDLRRSVDAAFEGLSLAAAPRATRDSAAPRVRVEIGERAFTAGAVLRPTPGDAAEIARRLVARVPGTSADVFPVRGGNAVLARADGDGAAMLDHLVELAQSPPIASDEPFPSNDGPRALARWIGARWSARGEAPITSGIAVGAVIAGGRGDSGEDDPDRERRSEAERALSDRIASPPPIAGRIEGESADVELANGARARVRRMRGASRVVAYAIFEGGARDDPPRGHGATSLLARAARSTCAGVLRSEVGRADIRIDPVVRADVWGLRLEGPVASANDLAFLAARCPNVWDATELELARAEAHRDANEPLAAMADLLSPHAPGRIARDGRASEIASIASGVVRQARVGARRGRLVIAGDVPVEATVRTLAYGVARWPAGSAVNAAAWEEPSIRFASIEGSRPGALVAWLAPGVSERAAEAFSADAMRALGAQPGIQAIEHMAGAMDGRGWAIVSIACDLDALDALPSRIERALAGRSFEEVARTAAQINEEEDAWQRSTPRSVATELAFERATSDEPLEAQLRRFAESAPFVVIVRPQPAR